MDDVLDEVDMMVELLSLAYGYGPHCYQVRPPVSDEFRCWLFSNGIDHLMESSGGNGQVIRVRHRSEEESSRFTTMFNLRWL
jgi:hypothetical protein